MPDILPPLPRRRMLAASAAALPVLLGTAACRSSDLFAGPDPLAGRPPLSHDVITLQAAITAEQAMIRLYQAAVGSDPRTTAQGGIPGGLPAGLLAGLLAQHRQHLARLKAMLVVPAGAPTPTASATTPGPGATGRVTIARLRAAETSSAADLVQRLATVEPSLAQLFASIAASDATHAVALGG